MKGMVQRSINGLRKSRLHFCNSILNLIVMSVLNAELVFPVCGNICSHFSNFSDKQWIYMVSSTMYRLYHCLKLEFIPNSAELYSLGCHRPQSLYADCTASAVWAGNQTPLSACHKWLSLGIHVVSLPLCHVCLHGFHGFGIHIVM